MQADQTVLVERTALAFVGAVCADRRQADHLMQLVARTKRGGHIEMPCAAAEGLFPLTRHGLRSAHMVTPVENLMVSDAGIVALTSLGETLLKEMNDGAEI